MKRTTLALVLALAACGGGGSNNNGNPMTDAHGSGDGKVGDGKTMGSDGSEGGQLTIFTIVLENHDYNEIVGSSNAPYVNSLIAMGGLATNYLDSKTHPSLPNYLFLVSGATQYPGVVDVNPTTPPYFPADKPNLGTQLEAAGVKWRSYQESMPSACDLSASGEYAPKHDGFLYFKDQQSGANNLCADTNVDYASNFATDLATNTYRYMWITPNLMDDGHDPSSTPQDIITALTDSDTWLSTEVPKILASDAYKQGGVLFITWDEAEGRNGDSADQVPMIILSPKLKSAGLKVSTAYNHASYLATVEDLLGLPRLATVTSTPSMQGDFLQ
ncbi:MAG TPA: alkaline phosphatase family protein [Kofleriaceae bacterium]|nr:alkaline phosphatase family protein [Kofleriaceae bacterium]